MGRTSSAVKDRYNAKAYEEIKLRVLKGQKEEIQSFAREHGETVNAMICRLLSQEMGQSIGAVLKTPEDE